jgi:hypothetical protein
MLSYFSRKRNSPQKSRTSTIKNMFSRALGSVRPSRARIHDVADVAIELSTPRTATPRSASPRTATPRSAIPRTATPRSASPRSAAPRSASPRSAAPRSASPRTATPRTATPRSAAPSMKRHVPQEELDKFNTMRSESTALNTLTSKSINTQNEINKISRQIHLLKQKIIRAKKAEKDEYENTITNLEASKLALEKKLAEIKRNLRSVMGTIQNYSKKGGTRKRRKYAKKY